uniref:hypothetical protein n=1 Tax=Hydrogenophaga flava TaxID=65657 RepID=UPI000B031250
DAASLFAPRIEWSLNLLIAIVSTIFFFYSSSPRVRQTYLVSEILLLIIDYAKMLPPGAQQRLLGMISQEIEQFIADLGENNEDNIEAINLLFVHCTLGPQYQLNQLTFSKALGFRLENGLFSIPKEFGYFQIVSSIYVNSRTLKSDDITNLLTTHVALLFKQSPNWKIKTELVMLLLDISTCPVISKAQRQEVIKSALGHFVATHNLGTRVTKFQKVAERSRWFFNWNQEIDVSDVLRRKELKTPY